MRSALDHRPLVWCALVAACIIVGAADAYGVAVSKKNLLNNGDFRVGSGNSVDGWRTDAWVQDPGSTDYVWHPPQGGRPAEMEVFSHRDNDARWSQPLGLLPGWYHISVEARTLNAQTFTTGANISILEDGISSRDLRGTSDWQRIGFYLKVGAKGADVEVCLRLGGFGRLSRGDAFFRDAQVVHVLGPGVGEPSFDLTAIRKASASAPIGRPWTLAVTLLFLLILVGVGWRLMEEPRQVAAPSAAARSSRKRRAGAR